jgi:hypothetical protein
MTPHLFFHVLVFHPGTPNSTYMIHIPLFAIAWKTTPTGIRENTITVTLGALLSGAKFYLVALFVSHVHKYIRIRCKRMPRAEHGLTASFNTIVHTQITKGQGAKPISKIINHSSWASGPEIIALITPFPSSLFPDRVALNAAMASSNLNLCHHN